MPVMWSEPPCFGINFERQPSPSSMVSRLETVRSTTPFYIQSSQRYSGHYRRLSVGSCVARGPGQLGSLRLHVHGAAITIADPRSIALSVYSRLSDPSKVQIYGLQHLQSYRALRLMRNLQSPCARGSCSCHCASHARTYT